LIKIIVILIQADYTSSNISEGKEAQEEENNVKSTRIVIFFHLLYRNPIVCLWNSGFIFIYLFIIIFLRKQIIGITLSLACMLVKNFL